MVRVVIRMIGRAGLWVSTKAKIMREVVGNPLDDEPRLVLADWFDEQQNPRGQFIRVQCQRETQLTLILIALPDDPILD